MKRLGSLTGQQGWAGCLAGLAGCLAGLAGLAGWPGRAGCAGWLAWLAGLAGWAGRLGWLGWQAGLAGLAVLCWLGFFQCPAHGFYTLLLILTAICTGFKSAPQKNNTNIKYN